MTTALLPAPAAARRICATPGCGTRLSRYGDGHYCALCLRRHDEQAEAEPSLAGQDFRAAWLVDLLTHWGHWRHPRDVAPNAPSGELCVAARDLCHKWRHWGWVIESGARGYRVTGYEEPATVWLLKPGRPAPEAETGEIDGQLQLTGSRSGG